MNPYNNQRQAQTDFSVAKMWTEDDIQSVLIDLSIARSKPVSIDLGGRNIYVSNVAWDDKDTISLTKTVGSATCYINSNNGNPIELTSGISYEDMGVFDNLWIKNTAQPGKMLKIQVTNETKIKPFSSEIKISGGDPSNAGVSIADVACPAGATTLVLAANPVRKTATLSNLALNGTQIRVGDLNTGAARGTEVPNGASVIVAGNDAIYVYNPLGVSINIGVTYDEA